MEAPEAAWMRHKDGAWIRDRTEGQLGQWHMPAGHTRNGTLAACDQMFPDDAGLEERSVDKIPSNERCRVCQGVHAAAERNLTTRGLVE